MKEIKCDGFNFTFSDAIDVFVFDEKKKSEPNYHGLSHAMKAVDLVVELEDRYLFVEVKDFHEPEQYSDNEHFNHLREVLKYKYRDTWMYRWAEGKTDKPVIYICLLELDKGLTARMTKEMRRQLPLHSCKGPRWCNEISSGCAVLNLDLWNKRFTAWPVSRAS